MDLIYSAKNTNTSIAMPTITIYDRTNNNVLRSFEAPLETIEQSQVWKIMNGDCPGCEVDEYPISLDYPPIAEFLEGYLSLPYSTHDYRVKKVSTFKFNLRGLERFERFEDFRHDGKRKLFESVLDLCPEKDLTAVFNIVTVFQILELSIGLTDVSILLNEAVRGMSLYDFVDENQHDDDMAQDQALIDFVDHSQSMVYVYDE